MLAQLIDDRKQYPQADIDDGISCVMQCFLKHTTFEDRVLMEVTHPYVW